MNTRDEIVLKKIIQYADEISETISRFNLTQDSFTEDFKAENNAMPWREIKAMRNIAAHNYGEIDIDILWETATCDIPDLKEYCQKFIG